MSSITTLIRPTRFRFKETDSLKLIIETKTGSRLTMSIVDASINGVCALLPGSTPSELDPGGDDLIPAAKIVCDGQEIPLGRLVLRRVIAGPDSAQLAFSTVDFRVPVDGILGRYVDAPLDSGGEAYEFELDHEKFNLSHFREDVWQNPDIFHRCEIFEKYFGEWKESAKYAYYTIRTPSQGKRVNLRKPRKGSRTDFLVMGSNDYLGLAAHPEVREAAKKAIDDYGFGSTGSPTTTGLTLIHEELSETLARLLKKEKVLLFNSGYGANIGIISGLTRAHDLILADNLSHASIQDGLRMSDATSRLYMHNDVRHLETLLQEHRKDCSGALVITEGVFSMDGDTPPLSDILRTAEAYKARVMVDEAHSFGIIGPTGLGAWETCPGQKVDMIMGTFSKICGGIGGFVAADTSVADWLFCHARAHIFSVAIPPSTAAAALAAIKIFVAQPELLRSLKANIRHFVEGLRSLGASISLDHPSAVIPVVIGDEVKLNKMSEVMRENGIHVVPIIYPAVSRKNSRFRFTIMADHTVSDLDFALSTLERAMEAADFSFKKQQEIEATRAVPIRRVA